MAKTGQNINDIKHANRSLLLNLLYFSGAQSRKALSQKAGLTAAAITMIVNDLIEDHAVIETDKVVVDGRLGRNEQLIDLNYKALFVVGIHFGVELFEINLTRLDGKVISLKQYDISLINGKLFGETLAKLVNDAINEFSVPAALTVGVGVTIRGIVDSENGISINSYGVLANNLNIKSLLNEHISLPIFVENNVRSMLIADIILRHAQPTQSTLFIKYGPGVGGALLLGQKSYSGSKHRAIEVGHICVEVNGKKCRCGKTGCLETLISFDSIIENARQVFSDEQTPVLFRICSANKDEITIKTIVSAYEKEDSGIEHIIDSSLKYFALSISNCASLLDPEIVVLCSEMFVVKKIVNNLQKAILSFGGIANPKYLVVSDDNKLEICGPASIAINNFLATGSLRLEVINIANKEKQI